MRSVRTLAVWMVFALGSVGAFGADVERREQGNLMIENEPTIPQGIVDRMMQYQSTRAAWIRGWDAAGQGFLSLKDVGGGRRGWVATGKSAASPGALRSRIRT